MRYQNQDMEEKEEVMKGLKARVFQQQFDFLYGKDILDWKNNHGLVELYQ